LFRNEDVFEQVDERLPEFGFGSAARSLVLNAFEGTLDAGKMMTALLQLCGERHIQVLNSFEVSQLEQMASGYGIRSEQYPNWRFYARQVAVCTNAWAGRFLPPELRSQLVPGRGLVLVTAPLERVPFRGAFHHDEGYVYFRDAPGRRVLIGGGRNRAFEEEATNEFGENPALRHYLEELLRTLVLPHTPHRVERAWSGIMAFSAPAPSGTTATKQPLVQRLQPHLFCAVRCGGMGVALGSKLGDDLADLILSEG
jgi:glycine/D-amino acid oxidase-like deaminating enzyme